MSHLKKIKCGYTVSRKPWTQVRAAGRCPRRPRAAVVRRGERGEPVKRRAAATGRTDRAPIQSINSQLLGCELPLNSVWLPTRAPFGNKNSCRGADRRGPAYR